MILKFIKYIRFTIVLSVISPVITIAQNLIPLDIGSHDSIEIITNVTSGYWFVSPRSFTITGLRVSTDSIPGHPQTIQIIRLDSLPSTSPDATEDFDSLGYWKDIDDTSIIITNITVATGDIIGVFGVGIFEGEIYNSFHKGAYNTTIAGETITLRRLAFANDLHEVPADEVYTEGADTGQYSRIELYYDTLATGINNVISADTVPLKVFPNPNRGEFLLEIDAKKVQDVEIKLLNLSGQLIFYERIEKANGIITREINLPKCSNGIYLLKVIDDFGVSVRKVVVL